jgi:alanine-glyoxylate transaminase / serine-glyoxylate transaminase / serine-pyruvate transaminase
MTPPGIGWLAAGRTLAVAEANPAPRFYWDWRRAAAR